MISGGTAVESLSSRGAPPPFPGREAEELPLEHQIFHCVFHIRAKPQIPNVELRRPKPGHRRHLGGRGWKNAPLSGDLGRQGRLMVLLCHNTDLGDGWEEEATDPYYFTEFSEPKAYPLGINIIFYALTH
jgi:hypothetical protein